METNIFFSVQFAAGQCTPPSLCQTITCKQLENQIANMTRGGSTAGSLVSCQKKCCNSNLCNAPSNDETTPANLVPFTTGSNGIYSRVAQTTVETGLVKYIGFLYN